MRCNDAGIQIIKAFEGFRSKPYKCSANVSTVGFGSTRGFDNGPVRMDMEPVTREEAEELLRRDIRQTESAVGKLIKVALTENEFSALCSFCYNVGSGNLQRSSLRLKLNRNDRLGAADEFPKWRRAAGKILRGLVLRREAERILFMGG
jgi:lysozyme